MKAVFTARRLNAGHYDDFRKAWEPDQWPMGFKGAYLMRDTADPDQITVMGLFDVSDDDAARMQTDLEPSERDRHERMAPHIADTLVSGLFDIVVHESGGATGNHSAVLLTERTLKPGSFDGYMDAGRQMNEDMGGMPAGLEFMLLQDTANRRPRHPARDRPRGRHRGVPRLGDARPPEHARHDRAVRRVGRAWTPPTS